MPPRSTPSTLLLIIRQVTISIGIDEELGRALGWFIENETPLEFSKRDDPELRRLQPFRNLFYSTLLLRHVGFFWSIAACFIRSSGRNKLCLNRVLAGSGTYTGTEDSNQTKLETAQATFAKLQIEK